MVKSNATYVVDCAAPATLPRMLGEGTALHSLHVGGPCDPQTWTVEHHDTSLGMLELNPDTIELYLSKQQQTRPLLRISGGELYKELLGLKDKALCNANVLDYLLAHPERAPLGWEGSFFWGTLYKNRFGRLIVRGTNGWIEFRPDKKGGAYFLDVDPAAVITIRS